MVELTQIATSPRSPTPAEPRRAGIPTVVGLAPGEQLHTRLIAHDEETTLSVVEGVVRLIAERRPR